MKIFEIINKIQFNILPITFLTKQVKSLTIFCIIQVYSMKNENENH